MGEWRKQEGHRKRESDRRGPSAANSRNWSQGKPPRIPDENADVRPVSGWEKKFCFSNGISWGKVLETKQYLHQYSDITGWDDSAAKEAFDNAKARYWAQINGLQPKTPLPDPDSLIDRVDHDAQPSDDLKLYENLRGSLSDEEGEDDADGRDTDEWGHNGGVILWDSHYSKRVEEDYTGWTDMPTGPGENRPIIPTGWGDDIPVQPSRQLNNSCGVIQTGWGDNSVNPDASPETTYKGIVPTGWGEFEGGSWNYGANDGNWVEWSRNNGYGYDGRSGEAAGQYWNYGENYWNSGGLNGRDWGKYNQNSTFGHGDAGEMVLGNYSGELRGYKNGSNRNGAGRSGGDKNRNKNSNRGKQWRRKEGEFPQGCAPLNQPDDAWVPRTVA